MEHTSLSTQEFPLIEQSAAAGEGVTEEAVSGDAIDALEEIEDELIIEDFTIDGICGVY